jgi:hypothetical protein
MKIPNNAWKFLGAAAIASFWAWFSYSKGAPEWAVISTFGIIYSTMYATFTGYEK